MTLSEISDSLYTMSRSLNTLSELVDQIRRGPEPNERSLAPQDILRGPGKLSTVAFAPGYRDAILVLTMANEQTLKVCLTVRDSLFLHEELASMIELAGDRPLGEGDR